MSSTRERLLQRWYREGNMAASARSSRPPLVPLAIQFSTDDYGIGEGNSSISITVTRSGNASGTATVNYATFVKAKLARQSKDRLRDCRRHATFRAGETSKTFSFAVDDGL